MAIVSYRVAPSLELTLMVVSSLVWSVWKLFLATTLLLRNL